MAFRVFVKFQMTFKVILATLMDILFKFLKSTYSLINFWGGKLVNCHCDLMNKDSPEIRTNPIDKSC